MNKRDDFSNEIKEMLARRVASRCSNPACQKPTSGPQSNPQKAINIGVAAHITAAAPGGKRYDPTLSRAERSSIENGIWLCQNCGKLIDSDEHKYSVVVLKRWKKSAEQCVRDELSNSSSHKSLAVDKSRSKIKYQRDLGTLRLLFENLNTHALDSFFIDAQAGYIFHDILFYEDIITEIVNASDFHLYDDVLRGKFVKFYSTWKTCLNTSDNDFVLMSNPWISKFIVDSEQAANRLGRFVREVKATGKAFHELVQYVNENYLELDFKETDGIARRAFLEYKAENDEYIYGRKRKMRARAPIKKRRS